MAALGWEMKMADDVNAALGWLEEADPEKASADDDDDDDWLGLGDTISIPSDQLGDRYVVEATLRRLTNKIHSSTLDETA